MLTEVQLSNKRGERTLEQRRRADIRRYRGPKYRCHHAPIVNQEAADAAASRRAQGQVKRAPMFSRMMQWVCGRFGK